MMKVGDVCHELQRLAPLRLAEDWDNVGLLLGDLAREIQKVLTCLTLTHDVAAEAIESGAGLIVTHHPILFKPVKKITSESNEGRLLLSLLRHGIAVYSPHTAWDNSATGINQQLADLLGLQQIQPLRSRPAPEQVKLVTFVPETECEVVRSALWEAGAGVIGNYQNCSFQSHGIGTFFGSLDAQPAIGRSNQLEKVEEIRLEVICPMKNIEKALRSVRAVHPYEEPAIDVYPVKSPSDTIGIGRLGVLPSPMSLEQLTLLVAERLGQPSVQFVGEPSKRIERLAIACGSAAEFLRDASQMGCQAFLTGEARFHSCLEAAESGIGMILPGHYATERFGMESMASLLTQSMTGLIVSASQRERDPVQSRVIP